MEELKRCPFCGGKAQFSHREMRFFGQNFYGAKKIKFGGQVICNRCKARGPLFTRVILIGTPSAQDGFAWLADESEKAWNRRANDAEL